MSTEFPGSAGVRPAPGKRDDAAALPGAAVVLPLAPGIIRRQRRPGPRPLPDAVALAMAVRMLAVPDSAPPYDDEASAGGKADGGRPAPGCHRDAVLPGRSRADR